MLAEAAHAVPRRRRRHLQALRRMSAGNVAMFCALGWLVFATALAVWPKSVTSFDPTLQHLSDLHRPPGYVDATGGRHVLGTDHLGRDELSRLVYGARASLSIGYSGLALGAAFGVTVGVIASYRGGWIDRLVAGTIDLYLSFPYVLIAIVWAALVRQTALSLVIIIAVRGWVEFARVVRADVLSKKEREYVTAARSLGAGELRIVGRHILPHILSPVLVLSGFQLGSLILLEATLSFLGVGIRPPTPSWGSMLADGQPYIVQAWWTVALPSIAISLVILSTNLLGDGLRDLLDPGLHGRQ